MIPAREPIKVLADILQSEMGLINGQLMLGLENYRIPKTKGLYVALYYGPIIPIGVDDSFCPIPDGGAIEVQSAALLGDIVLEAMSFNEEARLRNVEILLALNSIYSQQAVGKYFMRINNLPREFSAVPELEETKQLNKFRIVFAMNWPYQKVKPVSYYDVFPTPEVTTDA